MKRVIVKEGKPAIAADTSSGEATPTREAGEGHSGNPQTVEEKTKRSAGDLEKGFNGGENGADDVEGEKGKNEEEYVKKV